MSVILGTKDGVWEISDGRTEQIGLAGKYVSHVATHQGITLASVPHDGLYSVLGAGDRSIWQGDARSCAVGPDGKLYVGTEPAMIFRSDDGGESWRRLSSMDQLPTRESWYFPPPPYQPHVRSIDFLPNDRSSVLAGVEVGGVFLSRDHGETWEEANNGVHVDVHTVRPDPSQPGRLIAVTGGGIFGSEDGGETWEPRMGGVPQGYAVGLHINPERAGELMSATGERPPGVNGRVHHSIDAGRNWMEIRDPNLPARYARVPVVFFAEGAAWIAMDTGRVLRADKATGSWSPVAQLPCEINAAAAGGSPSSISSGYMP